MNAAAKAVKKLYFLNALREKVTNSTKCSQDNRTQSATGSISIWYFSFYLDSRAPGRNYHRHGNMQFLVLENTAASCCAAPMAVLRAWRMMVDLGDSHF